MIRTDDAATRKPIKDISFLCYESTMYLNIFRHRKKAGIDLDAYQSDAAHMEALAREQPGFLAYRRYSSTDGEALSISEWESVAAARAWARHPEHVAVQTRARTRYYQSYVVYCCESPDIHTFDGDDQ